MSVSASRFRRDIFSIVGLPPEVLAVAMAKYSRSTKSIRDTIDELTEEKSAEFHEKWVLGYGDASVADMAVIAFALENISILASKAVEDHRLASYQEKSTRYVPFDEERTVSFPITLPLTPEQEGQLGRYVRPASVMASPHAVTYLEACESHFRTYREVAAKMADYYRRTFPKPDAMTEKAYAAKIRARSLDVARYCLPVSTLTNFGMTMNARTLRHTIAVLKGSELPEVRDIGADLQTAATNPAYNPQAKRISPLIDALRGNEDSAIQNIGSELDASIRLQIKGAPTLIKHTDPKPYLADVNEAMRTFAEEHLRGVVPDAGARLSYARENVPPEDELIATLLYSVSPASYEQILQKVEALSPDEKTKIISRALVNRSQWDWPTRHFEVHGAFVFDTLMDYGAFRDLQRHRMVTQINQSFTTAHGYEIPSGLGADEAGVRPLLESAFETGATAFERLRADFPTEAAYVIPMGFRKRTLFKMNLRELYHIVELRTKPGGHLSYRELCYEIFERVRHRHPGLVASVRAVRPNFSKEFFER